MVDNLQSDQLLVLATPVQTDGRIIQINDPIFPVEGKQEDAIPCQMIRVHEIDRLCTWFMLAREMCIDIDFYL